MNKQFIFLLFLSITTPSKTTKTENFYSIFTIFILIEENNRYTAICRGCRNKTTKPSIEEIIKIENTHVQQCPYVKQCNGCDKFLLHRDNTTFAPLALEHVVDCVIDHK